MIRANSKRIILLLAICVGISALASAQLANPRQIGMPIANLQGNIPGAYQSGISALLNAKSSLERAGDRWGGHRVRAIHLIDMALQTAGHPQAESRGEMNSGPQDEPAAMQNGVASLQQARGSFAQAGGRAGNVIGLINQALSELQIGIQYAKSYHTY
jgi:hypothetical protein